jgi:cytochrome c553
MREELAKPYATRHFDQVALSAAALVRLNPSPTQWRDWDAFAQDAAHAARAHDAEHLLQACTRCHRAYRREYVEKFRQRALSASRDAM